MPLVPSGAENLLTTCLHVSSLLAVVYVAAGPAKQLVSMGPEVS